MASTHAREGGRFLQMGQAQDAVKSFQKGLSIDPKDEDCLLGLVRAHLSTGASGEAEAAALRLLEVQPAHTEAQAHLAMLRARAGDADALEALKALAAAPNAGYFERFNLGGLLLERGDLAGARAAFESALEVAPDSAHVHFELGRICSQQNELKGALAHFAKAAEGAPNEAMPFLMLSRVHTARGEVGLAMQAGSLALERAHGPLRRSVLEDVFKLSLMVGSPDSAKRTIVELRQLDPSNLTYVYMHGLAVMSAGAFADAKGLFEDVLRNAPKSWQARHALAQAELALGQRERARTLLEEAVEMVPTDPGPANDLAVVLVQDGEHARARPLLERVVEKHPNDAGTHLNLAVVTFPTDKAASAHHATQARGLGDERVRQQAAELLKQLGL
jgi:tetratricopeptide (TPR) repeat protein